VKSKIWLLAALVAALGIGLIWKILRHRDLPSKEPAAVAAVRPLPGRETQASTAPADASIASTEKSSQRESAATASRQVATATPQAEILPPSANRPAEEAVVRPLPDRETQASTAPADASRASAEKSSQRESAATASRQVATATPQAEILQANRPAEKAVGGLAIVALHKARGVLVSHSAQILLLESDDQGRVDFDLPDGFEAAITRSRLENGDRVIVMYTEHNGRKIAESIHASYSGMPAAKAAERRAPKE